MSDIDPRIFRAYDIRGKAHDQLTTDAAEKIGRMFGTILRETYAFEHPSLIVGWDARTHSPGLAEAAIKGLMSAGCRVLVMGETPSPLNYFTTCRMKLDGGLQITASHNPKEDNGIKLQMRDAEAYSGDDLQILRKRIDEGKYLEGKGSQETIDAVTPYLAYLKKEFGTVGNGRRIVVDGGNGVTGPVYCAALKQAGCALTELYTDPDGNFPNHAADPSQHSTLRELQETVKKKHADLGFGFDGDGDRLGLVDDAGSIRSSDEVLLLLAKDHLSRCAGMPVIFTVSNSGILETEIQKWSGKPVMCKVGHSYVEHAMREHEALLGGEQSGHFFCAEDYFGFDDALVAALRVLKSLEKKSVTEAMKEFPKIYQAHELRPHCDDDAKAKVIHSMTKHFQKDHPVNTLDGARIDFGDGAWTGIRQSNTSPRISICMEARSPEKLKQMENIVMAHLKTYSEIDWEK